LNTTLYQIQILIGIRRIRERGFKNHNYRREKGDRIIPVGKQVNKEAG